MKLIDSHCHFDFEVFDVDRDDILNQCRQLGLSALCIPGVSPEQWPRARSISECWHQCFFAVGLHPWWLAPAMARFGSEMHMYDALEKDIHCYAQHPRCVAIGECGLDKLRGGELARQRRCVEWQLGLANAFDKPVIFHCVQAHDQLLALLKSHPLKRGGVVHGFSGSPELAHQYWALGLHVGVGGGITYERAKKTRAAVQQLPLEALVLETDAPAMPLAGRQGQRNSPEYIPEILRELARLRNESMDEIAEAAYRNTVTLLGIADVIDGH